MSENIQAEYEAYWDCPSCELRTTDSDEGVDVDGEEFHITCAWVVDKDGVDLEACGHQYTVRR